MKRFGKKDGGDILFDVVKYGFLTIFVLLCIYPFYYVVICSLSDPKEIGRSVYLWPRGFNLNTYTEVLKRGDIVPAFLVSSARTVLGTTVTVLCTCLLAFLVTRRELPHRKLIYRYCVVSMYLGAGLIPWYITMRAYGFQNKFMLYIIPSAVNVYQMILVKTFMEQLPDSLEESAALEGAGFLDLFLRIVMPLSKPIVATIAVYNAVGQWNSWQDNFFLNQDKRLQTLQLILQRYLQNAKAVEEMISRGQVMDIGSVQGRITSEAVQMTTVVITVLPIFLVYPFAQKYFTKGIMMGAIKG